LAGQNWWLLSLDSKSGDKGITRGDEGGRSYYSTALNLILDVDLYNSSILDSAASDLNSDSDSVYLDDFGLYCQRDYI
jgi:hypothetical protein